MTKKPAFDIDDLVFDFGEDEESDSQPVEQSSVSQTKQDSTQTNDLDDFSSFLEDFNTPQINSVSQPEPLPEPEVQTEPVQDDDYGFIEPQTPEAFSPQQEPVVTDQQEAPVTNNLDSFLDSQITSDSNQEYYDPSKFDPESNIESTDDILNSFFKKDEDVNEFIQEEVDAVKYQEKQKQNVANKAYDIFKDGRNASLSENVRKDTKPKAKTDYYVLEHDSTYVTDEDEGYDLFYEDVLPIDYEEIKTQNRNKGTIKKLVIAFLVFAVFIAILVVIANRYFTDESVHY